MLYDRDPHAADALFLYDGGDEPLRWPGHGGEPVRITYAFYRPGDGPLWAEGWAYDDARAPTTGERRAIERALAVYESRFLVDFVPIGGDSARADIRFAFADSHGRWAGLTYPWASGGRIEAAEVVIDPRAPNNRSYEPGTGGFHTLLHEIGHALGLDHPFEGRHRLDPAHDNWRFTLMSYDGHPGVGYDARDGWLPITPRTPMPYDHEALAALYGLREDHHAGDDRYVYADGVAVVETLYDTGGHDLIDASGQVLPVEIDLRPGAFSSIGRRGSGRDSGRPAEGNIAILEGSWIEDAVGGAGDDRLIGNARANRLEGGAGDDRLEGGAGDDVLVGGAGLDTLVGGAGHDLFVGTLAELAGDRLVDFGADAEGRDVLRVRTPDPEALRWWTVARGDRLVLHLEDGRQDAELVLEGTAGGRLVPLDARADHLDLALELPGSAPAPRELALSDGPDRWTGTAAAETVHALGGHDRLQLGDGADLAYGGDGNDRIRGGAGDDALYGGAGRDRLWGDDGRDLLFGGDDADRLWGGAGDDELAGGAGRNRLSGGAGDDLLRGGDARDILLGGDGDDELEGGGGTDRLAGGTGDDRLAGGAGDDRIVGGAGFDTVLLAGAPADYRLIRRGQRVLIEDLRPEDGDDGRDRLHGVERLVFEGGGELDLAALPPKVPATVVEELIATYG